MVTVGKYSRPMEGIGGFSPNDSDMRIAKENSASLNSSNL